MSDKAMNKNRREGAAKKIAIRSAKEVAFPSVFVALTIGAQAVFAAVPGVELVTVLFVCYAFSFGAAGLSLRRRFRF